MQAVEFYFLYLVMDFWTVIGIVSSILGIFSFLKNDTSFFKNLQICHILPYLKKYTFVFFSGQSLLKKT
ncbi:hypothetical protein EB354_14275 [Chryseobacterium balustinum]|nr:hypothetical protein EB354_14235 [Chryseobacterium balustinum]AZB30327.1 hypothetical protein EB354_14275 [Chryseobacterium balustinum]